MAAPFWKADPSIWPLAMQPWIEGSTPWPAELVAEDLRWWADQVAVKREVLPGRPTLARRWSWTDWAVKKALQEHDPLRRQPTASRPPADRQRTASAPPAQEQANADELVDSASAPPADRQPTASAPPADRHARVVDRADRATEQTDVQTDVEQPPADPPPAIREPVLVHPVASPPDDWTQLAAHYGALPWARRPNSRTKGNGKHLATVLREAGSLADARTLLDWWATADDDRALFLRYGKAGEPDPLKPNAPPSQGLDTVARHAEAYLERAIAWQARGSPVERGRGSHGGGYTPRAHRPSDDEPELDF